MKAKQILWGTIIVFLIIFLLRVGMKPVMAWLGSYLGTFGIVLGAVVVIGLIILIKKINGDDIG